MQKFLTVIDDVGMYSLAIDDLVHIEYNKKELMIGAYFKSKPSRMNYCFKTEEKFKEMSDHIFKTLTEQ